MRRRKQYVQNKVTSRTFPSVTSNKTILDCNSPYPYRVSKCMTNYSIVNKTKTFSQKYSSNYTSNRCRDFREIGRNKFVSRDPSVTLPDPCETTADGPYVPRVFNTFATSDLSLQVHFYSKFSILLIIFTTNITYVRQHFSSYIRI